MSIVVTPEGDGEADAEALGEADGDADSDTATVGDADPEAEGEAAVVGTDAEGLIDGLVEVMG
jgi:hypothetical protein